MSYPFIPTPKPFFEKVTSPFTFDSLISQLSQVICNFPDKRTGTNIHYNMFDIALEAYLLFFTQNPSFLPFQRHMERKNGKSNAQSLFQIDTIPSDNHMRDMIDEVPPELLYPVLCIYLILCVTMDIWITIVVLKVIC